MGRLASEGFVLPRATVHETSTDKQRQQVPSSRGPAWGDGTQGRLLPQPRAWGLS